MAIILVLIIMLFCFVIIHGILDNKYKKYFDGNYSFRVLKYHNDRRKLALYFCLLFVVILLISCVFYFRAGVRAEYYNKEYNFNTTAEEVFYNDDLIQKKINILEIYKNTKRSSDGE